MLLWNKRLTNVENSVDSIKTAISILTAKVSTSYNSEDHMVRQLRLAEIIEKNFEALFSEINNNKKKKLGQILIEQGNIQPEDLERALQEQKELE